MFGQCTLKEKEKGSREFLGTNSRAKDLATVEQIILGINKNLEFKMAGRDVGPKEMTEAVMGGTMDGFEKKHEGSYKTELCLNGICWRSSSNDGLGMSGVAQWRSSRLASLQHQRHRFDSD